MIDTSRLHKVVNASNGKLSDIVEAVDEPLQPPYANTATTSYWWGIYQET